MDGTATHAQNGLLGSRDPAEECTADFVMPVIGRQTAPWCPAYRVSGAVSSDRGAATIA